MNNLIKKLKNNKKEKNNKVEKLDFLEGGFSDKDYLAPSYINLSNPKYIEIDNNYYASLLIINYFREQTDLILKSIIDTNIDVNISIFYEKQDTYLTLNQIIKIDKILKLRLLHIMMRNILEKSYK